MTTLLQPERLAHAKLLLRVPNWVGDAVMCLPAIRALRRLLPEAEFVVLARPWVQDIFAATELNCRMIPYDTRGADRGLQGRLRIASELRREQFTAAILFQNAFDAALISWLARIPIRAGYARQGRAPLLTHPVPPPRRGEIPAHESHYYLEMLRRLGLIREYAPVEQILLANSPEAQERARQQLSLKVAEIETAPAGNGGNPSWLVGISPGASFGTAKRWPVRRFAELTARLGELGAKCVFFGSSQESGLVDDVIAESKVAAPSLAGKTSLREFMDLVQGCDLFLTNDTGTMHVAAGLGVPTLALFGPTNEHETKPLGPNVEVVVGEAFCRPCKLRHCPIDHRCMKSVSVDSVLQACQSMLLRARQTAFVPAGAVSFQQQTSLRQEQRGL